MKKRRGRNCMRTILEYTENNLIYMIVLWGVMILAAVFWNLYRREKKAARKAREELRGGKKFYSSFENNRKTAYVFVSEKNRKVLYATPNLELVTGIRPDDLKTDTELMTGLIVRKEAREIAKQLNAWNKEQEFSSEVNYHRSGEKELRRGQIQILYCEKDGGYLLILSDITEEYEKRQEMERELITAQKESQSKTDFLSQMSHEIRTPMNGILGMLSLLKTHLNQPAAAEEYLAKTENLSHFLLTLINDILDISRLETGKLKFSYEECEVVSLGQRIMATTSYSKKEEVEYVYRPFTDSFVIETDVQRLQQILINLLSNANKFTLKGQIILGIEQDADGESLIFSVTDTGCGIPLEKQQKVFERFEKLDEYVQGTGLGLAICKITVGILGGEIWIDQDYTDGARFMFSHPIRRKKSLNESR